MDRSVVTDPAKEALAQKERNAMRISFDDPKVVYVDIIHHPHHQPKTRAHMSLYDRATQFSAFDALAGYSDMIAEEARIAERKIELNDDEKDFLNSKLSLIDDLVESGQRPVVSFIVFVAGPKKAGGEYWTIADAVKGDNANQKQVVLESRRGISGLNARIDFSDIASIVDEINMPFLL